MTADSSADRGGTDWLLCAVMSLLGACEGLLLVQLFELEDPFIMAAVHGGAVVCCFLLVRLLPLQLQGSALWPMVPVVVLILGPFGAFGISLAVSAQNVFRAGTTRFDDWYQSLFPANPDPSERLFEDLALRGYRFCSQPDVVPLVDVARFGDVHVKQRLIVAVTERFEPSFAAFLGASLSDSEPAIRVQTATAMAKLENRFSAARRDLEGELPTNQVQASLDLAVLLLSFADSGLIDSLRARELRVEARRYAEGAIASSGRSLSAIVATARVCLSQGDHEEVIRILKPTIKTLDDQRASAAYATALFKQGCFGELHRYAQGLTSIPGCSQSLREFAVTWGASPS